jgi:23S rRNA pseudouridine1911/1915/1917 synthase
MSDYTEPAAFRSETLVVPTALGQGSRVDKFLASHLSAVSRTRIQKWIALGAVRINDAPVAAKYKLTGFETLEVDVLPQEADASFEPDPIDIPLHAEFDDFFVVNKPAGLVVHPGPGNWRDTLMNGLLFHYPSMATLPRAGIVHRLDKETSGLMLVARTEALRVYFMDLLARHEVKRTYWALVWGLAPKSGVVDQPIFRDPVNRLKMAVLPHGRAARTHFKLLASGQIGTRGVTLLELSLETGRTHQIRVHMQWLGFPLVGDPVYGLTLKGAKLGESPGFARQALHAKQLAFQAQNAASKDKKMFEFECDLPPDFTALLAKSGIHV